jgi:magnesium transporter
MPRFAQKKKEDIGLSPYALVFRGQQKINQTSVHVIDFDAENVTEFETSDTGLLRKLKETKTLSWINVYGLHETEKMERLSEIFEVPTNILSDIMNTSLRPKVQDFDKGLFITLKIIRYPGSENEQLIAENFSLLLLENVVLTFQEQPSKTFDAVRERIRKHKFKIRNSGADYLAFALLDVVIDNYIYVIGQLGEKVETLEDKITSETRTALLEEVNLYKKEMNFIRKNINPAREMILALVKIETEFIRDDNRLHYHELQDNINEATELSDSYREILYDQLTIYHSIMSTKLNDIMRTLTVFSVIFIPLTFIVGVYGTNFVNMPETQWYYGYYAMWGLMVVIAFLMLWYFKRKKWF